jgi:2,6-dihydroxypseudooxynicotine hydrolase
MFDDRLSYLWGNYLRRIKTIDEWPRCWSDIANACEERADAALRAGFSATAGAHLARASIYHFFGQFLLWDNPKEKRRSSENTARTFRQAAPYLNPPFQPVEIPFGDIAMPGYVRYPKDVKNPPCVLLLNGLDTTKEEQIVISSLCVERGLATITFDGPGQGETFY